MLRVMDLLRLLNGSRIGRLSLISRILMTSALLSVYTEPLTMIRRIGITIEMLIHRSLQCSGRSLIAGL
jgi:hypothetical protein